MKLMLNWALKQLLHVVFLLKLATLRETKILTVYQRLYYPNLPVLDVLQRSPTGRKLK